MKKIRVYCENCFTKFFTTAELKGLPCIQCKKIIITAAKLPANTDNLLPDIEEEIAVEPTDSSDL